jgi:hypothetical protein
MYSGNSTAHNNKKIAEISTAARARMVSVQDTVDLFARLNVESERDKTPQQMSSVMPSTELRRNVTRRRSNDRARDSVSSTSVPIRSLVSRKPMERQKYMIYASELKVDEMQESGESIATFAQSPGITRRLIPCEEEDPIRHKVLQEMWVCKKILEEDIDEALQNQNSKEFYGLRSNVASQVLWEDAKTYVMQGMWRDMPDDARPWVNTVPH